MTEGVAGTSFACMAELYEVIVDWSRLTDSESAEPHERELEELSLASDPNETIPQPDDLVAIDGAAVRREQPGLFRSLSSAVILHL